MNSVLAKLALLCLLAMPLLSRGQTCRRIVIDDPQQHRILQQYVQECQKGYFFQDKGVVLLRRSTDEQGRLVWNLEATIDDRYKENPPTRWASFNGQITLVYDEVRPSSRLTEAQKRELLSCLDDVIGDRLYINPPKREDWYDVEERPGVAVLDAKTGKPLRVRRFLQTGGNPNNAQKVTFNADGTYTTRKPV